MIVLEQIAKAYGAVAALHPVNLEVPAGKTTVLMGPSGCGKSTLLRLMIGLINPDSGRIIFQGIELVPAALLTLRQKMGYVIQEGGLFPHLTVRANVALMARYLKWNMERIDLRLRELAELARFPQDRLGRFPVQLSGGGKATGESDARTDA